MCVCVRCRRRSLFESKKDGMEFVERQAIVGAQDVCARTHFTTQSTNEKRCKQHVTKK